MQRILLIDLSSIFWANWHASAGLEVNECFVRTVDKVHRLASGYDHAAVCCDLAPYRRKDILPTYKAQRDAPSEVAVEQLRRVKERLTDDGFPVWEQQGFEADDVIASATEWATSEGHSVVIASGDKDLMQLVSDNVTMLSVKDGSEWTPERVSEKFGVEPALVGDALALIGDASDNVPGVPGIGPKKAATLIATFGSLDEVLSRASEVQGAMGESLRAHVEDARLARRLISLDFSVELDWSQCLSERGRIIDTESAEPTPVSTDADAAEEQEQLQRHVDEVRALQKPARSTETTIVRHVDTRWELALEPQDMPHAIKLAKFLFESRLFGQFANEQAILATILRGRALGLDATTSLANFHVIEGKPAMNAQLLIGLVLRSGAAEFLQWVESDAKHAKWVTKRKGSPTQQELSWTIEDACAAGLVEKHHDGQDGFWGVNRRGQKEHVPTNWDKHRATMLRWRCGVELARSVYPDIVSGLYIDDELQNI